MDFESRIRQVKEKCFKDMQLLVSQVDSSIHKHTEKRKELNKSHQDTLIEITKLEAGLPQLEADLFDAFKRKEAIISNNSLNILLLVPRTDITKLAEARTDETISAAAKEIHKLTEDSEHLTVQVTDIQSQLKSGTLNLEEQVNKISILER
ncbi:hypothetical protein Tco_1027814, partial [Tanacetum coccineum]